MVHAWVAWVLVAHMLFLALRYRKAQSPVLAGGFLMLFHPVFTMDAVSGDCGIRMMQASEIFTVILAGLLVAQVWMKGRNSK